MIGFDRPLKPEWIYKTLQLIEVGENRSKYNEPFEDIAIELVGKEGKRKVRTVIFRSFIYSLQEKRNVIENNLFIEWSRKVTLEALTPLFLTKILMDYEVCRFITQKINLSFDQTNHLSSTILSKKMVHEYGDRDIARRSVRAFLKTLVHFKIFEQIDTNNYRLIKKYKLNKEQVRMFIHLYSSYFLKSKALDLSHIENTLASFFEEPNFLEIAREFHTKDWEYIRDAGRNLLLLH